MTLAARPHYEFAKAARRIGRTVRCLRRETFVVVVVTVHNDIGVGFIQVLSKRFDLGIVSVSSA